MPRELWHLELTPLSCCQLLEVPEGKEVSLFRTKRNHYSARRAGWLSRTEGQNTLAWLFSQVLRRNTADVSLRRIDISFI